MKAKRINKTSDVYAKKSFGQNFLVDSSYIEKIISALNIRTGETVIEIGPGRGALTRKLIESKAKLFAIELDRDLISVLESEFSGYENFILIESDALKFDFRQIAGAEPVKLVANLPYYISTAILQRLIEQRAVFSEMVLMLQREVVERIAAQPGNAERGYFSVLIEAYCEIEKLFDVPPNAFRPIPKIWSSVIKLKIRDSNPITQKAEDEQLFWEIVSAGFAQKRKTIFNNLKNARFRLKQHIINEKIIEDVLEKAQVEKTRRAESLNFEEWKNIHNGIRGS